MSTVESNNIPNAKRLISALRYMSYNTTSALADLIDNSVDAHASTIKIKVTENDNKEDAVKIKSIEIYDNGEGMDYETLDESLRLGSELEKNTDYELGAYGMGLITASIAMGRRLTVITKTGEGMVKGIHDLDEIMSLNKFVKTVVSFDIKDAEPEDKEAIEFLKSVKSGTVVMVSKIDKCQWKSLKGLEDGLVKTLGQKFRKFLQSKSLKVFTVNEKAIKPIDPIFDFNPKLLIEDVIKLENGSIEVKVFELENLGIEMNKSKGMNVTNQGFYIMRNNREIQAGTSLGVFTKHNNLNLLRILFSYPATLDSEFINSFNKDGISLDDNQSVRNKLEALINPFVKQVRKNSEARGSANKAKDEDYTDIEKFITTKSNIIKFPKFDKKPTTEKDIVKDKKDIIDTPKTPRVINGEWRNKVKFAHKTLGEKGPIYEADKEGQKVVIYWNVDHLFYKSYILSEIGNVDVVTPIIFLIFALADAELISSVDSISQQIIENIRFDVGRTVGTLMAG